MGAGVNCGAEHGGVGVCVDIRGHCIGRVAEDRLEAAHFRAVAQGFGGEGVPQPVQRDGRQAELTDQRAVCVIEARGGDGIHIAGFPAGRFEAGQQRRRHVDAANR